MFHVEQSSIGVVQKFKKGVLPDGRKPIHGGAWTLVDVGTMAPANLEWTVNASVTGMSVVKSVSPARVAIEVLPAGTTIIFR